MHEPYESLRGFWQIRTPPIEVDGAAEFFIIGCQGYRSREKCTEAIAEMRPRSEETKARHDVG